MFLFVSMLLFRGLYAADDTVTIKLNITDSYSKAFLSGVSIINPQSGYTFATDGRGTATIQIPRSEQLFLFYPGYRTTRFSVADSAAKKSYTLNIAIEPMTATLNQPVIIRAPKTLEDIEAERKKLGITPRELERPEIVFTSPISALYEILSSRAKERETLKRQMEDDDRRRIFKELLRFYNENGLTDLPEEYFDEFISYCNLPTDFLKYSTDYEITKTVIGLYKRYGLDKGFIK